MCFLMFHRSRGGKIFLKTLPCDDLAKNNLAESNFVGIQWFNNNLVKINPSHWRTRNIKASNSRTIPNSESQIKIPKYFPTLEPWIAQSV